MRQKMRSECRVLLVHCVVAIVFSPGCMYRTGSRGKQVHQRTRKSGSKRGMKMRQKMRSEFCWFIALSPYALCSHQVVCGAQETEESRFSKVPAKVEAT